METLLQMFIDRWSKPYFNYCEENNLIYRHYWEHNWPDLSQGGDNILCSLAPDARYSCLTNSTDT